MESELLTTHEANLRHLCRCCGWKIPTNSKSAEKQKFKNEIQILYGIDIDTDVDDVHPNRICSACRLRLRRIAVADDTVNVNAPPLYIFHPHGENCSVCEKKVGKPKTKKLPETKLTIQKRGHSSSTDTDEDEAAFKRQQQLNEPGTTETFESSQSVIDSINCDLFTTNIANVFKCAICQGVPNGVTPAITSCEHIFCKGCIESWRKVSPVCPVCRSCIDDEDISHLHGHLLEIFDSLTVKCDGCLHDVPIKNFKLHGLLCSNPQKRKLYSLNRKQPIPSVSARHLRLRRLKPVINMVTDYCNENLESQGDVLFFMLKDYLKQNNDDRFKDIEKIWSNDTCNTMTPEQCLALRIDLLQSKGNYTSQYSYLKQNKVNAFQPPHVLDKVECSFFPSNVNFEILNSENLCLRKQNASSDKDSSLFDIMSYFSALSDFPELPKPNCAGVRLSYPAAVARSLVELQDDIQQGLRNHNLPDSEEVEFVTTIKDGGMGWVKSRCIGKNLYKCCLTKPFAFLSVSFLYTRHLTVKSFVYRNDKPNSVRTNRPLLEALADENNKASNIFCTLPIEKERQVLIQNRIKLIIGQKVQVHSFKVFNSMIDEKRDRADAGLQAAGSKYMCTLCYADRDTCITQLGSFEICRRLEETCKIAEFLRVNPENLSEKSIHKSSKGVKCKPVSTMQQIQKGIDATHADINIGQFFKKLIVREIAGVTSWEVTADIADLVKGAETKFDMNMKAQCGINPQLMMPGNYARTLFATPPSILLSLISNEEKREDLQDIMCRFNSLREVYRCNYPLDEMPLKVRQYKRNAVEMGVLLSQKFDYVRWPNYLHKIIEHVQQLIEDPNGPGSIGAFSSEGNEGGNKLFRHFRKNLARRGSTLGGLKDVLTTQWLYTSPVLTKLAEREHRKNKCSVCYSQEHIRRNCPLNPADVE